MIQSNSLNETFWGLKEDWWKQIYDGEVHKYGPEVFDKGLHQVDSEHNVAEPGYYASVKKASEYACNELGKPLTIECYKMIHQLACEHFTQLDSRVINVGTEDINKFRSQNCRSMRDIVGQTYEYLTPEQLEIRKATFFLMDTRKKNVQFKHKIEANIGSKMEFDALPLDVKQTVEEFFNQSEYFKKKKVDVAKFFKEGIPEYESALESIEEVEKQFEALRLELNLPEPFATLTLLHTADGPKIIIKYLYQDPKGLENIVNKLIECYNAKMSQLPSDPLQRNEEEKENSLRNVAELYQNLEWFHPFFDGQGRTDLVLLSKLLTENGFNPSTLYQPYFSTFEPLDKWVDYLKNGMRVWRDLRAALN